MTRITMDEYQRLAQRTSPNDCHDRMDNGVMGLIGETGEIVDVYKKYRYQSIAGTAMPAEKFREELGDVLWYIAELSTGMDMKLSDIARADFADFDKRADAESKKQHKQDLWRTVVGMACIASEICKSIEKQKFAHAEFLMRKMLAAAANLARLCGSSLQEVAAGNIEKLKRRYPDGFDAKISMNRYTE